VTSNAITTASAKITNSMASAEARSNCVAPDENAGHHILFRDNTMTTGRYFIAQADPATSNCD
jgi:hypothetical protein